MSECDFRKINNATRKNCPCEAGFAFQVLKRIHCARDVESKIVSPHLPSTNEYLLSGNVKCEHVEVGGGGVRVGGVGARLGRGRLRRVPLDVRVPVHICKQKTKILVS